MQNFNRELEAGRVSVAALSGHDLQAGQCQTCGEAVTLFRDYQLHANGAFWIIHQCPPPVEDVYPDDPNVRDGSGDIRSNGFYDEYPDDPYSYPDIPYVAPRGF